MVVKDLREECQTHGSNGALIIIASDGVWDHWAFDEVRALDSLSGCTPLTACPDAVSGHDRVTPA